MGPSPFAEDVSKDEENAWGLQPACGFLASKEAFLLSGQSLEERHLLSPDPPLGMSIIIFR